MECQLFDLSHIYYNLRLRLRDVYQPADRDPGDQGDAPQPHHGGLQLPPGGQVRRQPEGQGAQEDPGHADQPLEPGPRDPASPQLRILHALSCPARPGSGRPSPRHQLCRR